MEDTHSEWVRFEDYARLKAEVERLRKAGDAMVDYIERTQSNAWDIEVDGDDRIAEWNAAKEGKGQP